MAETFVTVVASGIDLGANNAPPRRVKLLPIGQVDMRDGRGPYMVRDQTHAARIVAATRAWLGSADMMFDYDHQSVFAAGEGKGGTAIAAGWAKGDKLSAEPDGIYANDVEWTAAARQKLAAREYRYLSPLFMAAKGSGDVMQLKNAALVNMGAIDLPAIAAGIRMGVKEDEGDVRLLTLEELRQKAAGSAIDVLTALTEQEQFQARKLGLDFATYLQAKIRQMEEAQAGQVAAALTSGEVAVCQLIGLDQGTFLASKLEVSNEVAASILAGQSWPASPHGPLSADEAKVCRLMGLTPEQFRAA